MAITDRPAGGAPVPAVVPEARQTSAVSRAVTQNPWSSGHQDSLDGLRVIAALAVLVTHVAGVTGFAFTGTPTSWATSRGDIGVPIFFALSGLLLFRPWARALLGARLGPSVRAYLVRRALRILPAYWVVVVVAMVFLNQGGHASSPVAWAQYLLLAQIYDPHPWWLGTGATGLAQMWSLAVEASFYLILPVLAVLLGRYANRGQADVAAIARRLLVGIAALGATSYAFMALTYYPDNTAIWLNGTLPRSMTWFAPGMALAVLLEWARFEPGDDGPARAACRAIASSGLACWLIAALTFALACTPLTGPETLGVPSLWEFELRTALYTVVALAIVAPAALQPATRTPMNAVLGNKVMRFFGRISYGIFLWQYLAIFALSAIFNVRDAFHYGSFTPLGTLVALFAVTIASCLAATASYYIIERPAQRVYRLARSRPAGRHELLSGPDGLRAGGRRRRRLAAHVHDRRRWLIVEVPAGHDQPRDQPADHDQA